MRIGIDDRSGFCFGVVNAITKAEEALAGETGEASNPMFLEEQMNWVGDLIRERTEE